MKFNKNKLIKSPLNYTGGKYKLLPQILPYFPNNIDNFIDLFCGGCNVGLNVTAKNIYCNDIDYHIINLLQYMKKNNSTLLNDIISIINKYKLTKENKEGYLQLRQDYNLYKNEIMLLVLIFHSFNNQIRFNKKDEYNLPFGKRTFNNNIKNNLIDFLDKITNININFSNIDFECFNIKNLNSNDFIYCDPPYLITSATYNAIWNEDKESKLLEFLDKVNDNNINFALSNVLSNKGKNNNLLQKWCKKYNVYHLNNTYNNCNYHSNNKNYITDEVLITNYRRNE